LRLAYRLRNVQPILAINADISNEAIFRALKNGVLRSTTLMTPCPWALHAMHFLADHPEIAFGVHLAVISEWADYRWGPLTSREKVPSLIDQAGYFYNFEQMPAFLAQVRLDELEMEFRTQIEAVLVAGLKPTHLDWHALRIGDRADICDLMLRLAREYGLALRVSGHFWQLSTPKAIICHPEMPPEGAPTCGFICAFGFLMR